MHWHSVAPTEVSGSVSCFDPSVTPSNAAAADPAHNTAVASTTHTDGASMREGGLIGYNGTKIPGCRVSRDVGGCLV